MKDREEQTAGPESGAYTWLKSASKAVVEAITEEQPSVSSVYNLLNHSELDLDIMVMILSHFLGTIEGSPNFDRSRPTAIAWVRIFEQARDQVKDRDMKAWAEQQAKEIKETLNQKYKS